MAKQRRTVTVLVVDDQPLVRAAFAALVAAQPGLALCGQAGTNFEALTRYQALRPDVVVVNLRLGSPEGLVTVRSLRSMDPRALVVAVTAFDKDADIPPAVTLSGIRGRLLKEVGAHQFAETIRAVARGAVVLPGRLRPRPRAGAGSPLTAREVEVVRGIARGLRNCDIGAELGITEGTVKIHVSHILGKLGVADRKTAALRLRTGGLLTGENSPATDEDPDRGEASSQGLGAAEPTVLRPSRPFGSAFWKIGSAQGS